MTVVKRVGLVISAAILWSSVVLLVRANTKSTTEPCLDNVVVEVSGACAVPSPSLLPAIPVATLALIVAIGVVSVVQRQRRRPGTPE